IAGLRALIAQKPGDAQAWQVFAQVMMHAGRLDEVTKELRSATERQPESVELLAILASLYRSANRPDDAEHTLSELVKRAPSPGTYLALAHHHGAQGDDAHMLEVFDEALHAFPDDAVVQRTRADALLTVGKLEEGRKATGDYAARFPD